MPGEEKFRLKIKLQALETERESFYYRQRDRGTAESKAKLDTIQAEIEFLKAQIDTFE